MINMIWPKGRRGIVCWSVLLQVELFLSTPGRGVFQASEGGERSVGIEKKGGSNDGRTKSNGVALKRSRQLRPVGVVGWMSDRRCDWNWLKLTKLGSR